MKPKQIFQQQILKKMPDIDQQGLKILSSLLEIFEGFDFVVIFKHLDLFQTYLNNYKTNLVLTEKGIKLFERITELAKERGIVDPNNDSAEGKAIWDQALKEFGIDL